MILKDKLNVFQMYVLFVKQENKCPPLFHALFAFLHEALESDEEMFYQLSIVMPNACWCVSRNEKDTAALYEIEERGKSESVNVVY